MEIKGISHQAISLSFTLRGVYVVKIFCCVADAIYVEYATLLIKDGMPIVHVTLQTGYDTQPGFILAFKNYVGTSPLQYKKQALA